MPRVLVVDDDKSIRDMISSLISDMGAEVEIAVDGAEAWEMIKQTPFDLVITDLRMPRMGGINLLKKIKKLPQETEVIIVTGYASLKTAIESLRLGAYDYIEKPISLVKVQNTIKQALEKIKLSKELRISIQKLRESNKELKAKHEELINTQEFIIQNEKLNLFSKVASFVAHNLKSSISTLSLMLQNSAKYMGNHAFLEESLNDITHEVKRMENLIGWLQYMPKEFNIPYQPTNINNIIQQSIDILYFEKGSNIRINKKFGEIPRVNGNPDLLKVAVSNIIKNGIEAMPNGGKLSISTGSVGSRTKSHFIQIEIEDQGTGLLPCFIECKLFKPFQSTKKTGLGLGLYHSQQIVERHGGTIRVRSRLNEGTTFTIQLPSSSTTRNIPHCFLFN